MKKSILLSLMIGVLFAQDRINEAKISYERSCQELYEKGRVSDKLISNKNTHFENDKWYSINPSILLKTDKYLVDEIKYFDVNTQKWINLDLQNNQHKYNYKAGYMIKFKYNHSICNFNCFNETDEKVRHIVEKQ